MPAIQDVVIIFCPPKSFYAEQPADMSLCRLVDCPECNEPMWLSEKKEELKNYAESLKKEIIFCCYGCFEIKLRKDPLLAHYVRIAKVWNL